MEFARKTVYYHLDKANPKTNMDIGKWQKNFAKLFCINILKGEAWTRGTAREYSCSHGLHAACPADWTLA